MNAQQRRKTTFFDGASVPEMTRRPSRAREVPSSVTDVIDVDSYFAGQMKARALVLDEEGNGPSLVEYWFAPNFCVPRHHHDTDQIVLVLEGELRQGNRVMGPGDGYFTPCDGNYSVTAGPDGCKLLEFRPTSEFSTFFVEADPARWERRV